LPRRTRRELNGGGIGRAVVAEEGADHGAWGIGERERRGLEHTSFLRNSETYG